MIDVSGDGACVRISGVSGRISMDGCAVAGARELFVSSCVLEDFSFLRAMPGVEKLVLNACKSEVWPTVPGNAKLRILRLHMLRQGKSWLGNVDFIAGFPGLEQLYLNVLDIERFPDLSALPRLHTIVCSGRKLADYSALEHAKSLTTYIGYMAADRHRTPAEAFIPILKNPSLQAFEYTQMFNVENRKLDGYARALRPDIIYPISDTSRRCIIAPFF